MTSEQPSLLIANLIKVVSSFSCSHILFIWHESCSEPLIMRLGWQES